MTKLHDVSLRDLAKKALGLIRTSQRLSEDKSLLIEEQFETRISNAPAREAVLSLEDYPTPTTRDLYNCLAEAYWRRLLPFLSRLPKSTEGDSMLRNFSIEWDSAPIMAIRYMGGWEVLCVKYIINRDEAQKAFYNAFYQAFSSISLETITKYAGVNEAKRSWSDALVLKPDWVEQGREEFCRKLTAEERI